MMKASPAIVAGLFSYSAVRLSSLAFSDFPTFSANLSVHLVSFCLRVCGIALLASRSDSSRNPNPDNTFFGPLQTFFQSQAFSGKYAYYIVAAVLLLQFAGIVGFDMFSLDDIFDGSLGVLCLLKIAESSNKKSGKSGGPKQRTTESYSRAACHQHHAPNQHEARRVVSRGNNTAVRQNTNTSVVSSRQSSSQSTRLSSSSTSGTSGRSDKSSPDRATPTATTTTTTEYSPKTSSSRTSISLSPDWSTETSATMSEESPCRGAQFVTMLAQSAKHGDAKRAEYWISRLEQSGVILTLQHYNTLLEACAKSSNIQRAEYWFKKMRNDGISPDVVSYTLLVNGHARSGELPKAESLIRSMHCEGRKGDAILYGALVHACVKAGKADRAEYWITEMEQNLEVVPNVMSFNMLLDAFAKRGDMQRASHWFSHMTRVGVSPNIISYNSMVDACAKSGDHSSAEAWMNKALVDKNVVVDVITYNAVIDACAKVGEVNKAATYIEKMREHGVYPDVISFTSVINGYAQLGDVDRAEHWLRKMDDVKVVPNIYSYNAVLNATVKANGSLDANNWLKRLSAKDVRPNVVTYTTLAQPFAAVGDYRVVELLMKKLECDGIEHNQYTFGVRLNACANSSESPVELATKIFEEAVGNPKIQVKEKLVYPFCRAVGRTHMAAVCERLGIQAQRFLKTQPRKGHSSAHIPTPPFPTQRVWGKGGQKGSIRQSSSF